MPRYDRCQGPDYVNLYFGWKILNVLLKVYAWAILIAVCLVWYVLQSIWPDYQQQIFDWCLGIGIFGVPVLLGMLTYFRARRRPRTMNEKFAALGMVPNPPNGVSWFRADGTPKKYDHATGEWS